MVSFFQIAISHLAYVATFSGQRYFGRSYFFTLFQSNYLDATLTFWGQLFLPNSYCFLLFQNSPYSQELFFQNNLFFFSFFYFLEQLFFSEELFRLKYLKKGYFFKADTSAQHQPFQESHILEKTGFSENQFPHYLFFQESCPFRATTFSKGATFCCRYLFRRATFLLHTFSEELLFHSCGPFSQLHFLFIR